MTEKTESKESRERSGWAFCRRSSISSLTRTQTFGLPPLVQVAPAGPVNASCRWPFTYTAKRWPSLTRLTAQLGEWPHCPMQAGTLTQAFGEVYVQHPRQDSNL